ncbi:hypothetical protein LTR08_001846 [Meristemomyces frigidus]|nr:hypothetical protein LTR08_001846 [Meristemomyces frigidus]
MDNSEWDYPYSPYPGEHLGDNGNLVWPTMPGRTRGDSNPGYLGVDEFELLSPLAPHEPARNAQFDPRELQQFARDLNEAPRAFIRTANSQRLSLPNHGRSHHSFSAAVAEPAVQNVYGQDYIPPGTVSASESGYVSYNLAVDPVNWPRTPLQQGFEVFTTGQLLPHDFQNNASPSIVSDPIADHARSQCARPSDAISESGYGSAMGSGVDPFDSHHQHELPSPLETSPLLSQHTSQQGEASLFSIGEDVQDLAGIGGGSSANQPDEDRQPLGIHVPYGADGCGYAGLSDAQFAAAMAEVISPVESVTHMPILPQACVDFYGAVDMHSPQAVDLPWARGASSATRPESLAAKGRTQSIKHSDGDFPCSMCDKRKKRECDLSCWKRFGSRNDWKRHEYSQHFLIQGWRCELHLLTGQKCGMLLHDEDEVHRHLERQHTTMLQHEMTARGMSMKVLLQRLADDMHLGREAHQQYFCGFCDKLIVQGPNTLDAFDERAKHIGDHYDKDDSNIDDWVCIEENRQKPQIVPSYMVPSHDRHVDV